MEQPLIVATDFSGLGSPEEAFKRLQVNHKIAFACEKDEPARKSYLANHNAEIFYNDVTTRDNKTAPYTDFYAFGFPCQAFSISGKRLGFEDTKGTLFFNSLEYIATHRPRVIVAENVKGLLSHDKVAGSKNRYGRTFGVIRDALAVTINGQHNLYKYDDCVNYHIHFQVLNTKDYGLPQNRERIFIVGFRDEEDSIRFKFPKKIPLQLKLKDLLEKNVPEKYYLSERALNRLLKRGDDLDNQDEVAKVITTTNQQSNLSFKNSGTLVSDELQLANPRTRMVKSTDSISPTIMANQAKQSTDSIIIHEIDSPPKNQVIIDNDNGKIRDIGDVSMSLDANYGKGMDNHGQRSMILENDEDVIFKTSHVSRSEEAKEIRRESMKKGKDYSPFSKKEVSLKETGIMNTLTTAISKDNLIMIEKPMPDDSILFNKENTAKGYTEAQTLDTGCQQGVLMPLFDTGQNNQSERVYSEEGIAQTQSGTADGGGAKTGLYLTNKRIRRLIPLECFRLQGYSDEFFAKCQSVNSDTQLYRQAGNSISVDTFVNLLIQILIAIKIPFKNG